MKKQQVSVPFCFGSIAFQLNKSTQDVEYKWLCYIRGVNNEDLSFLIKKVVFHLHPSCGNPLRQVTKYPFQINQIGWGQFQILIDIYLQTDTYQPIKIIHQLKLHHSVPGAHPKKPLCLETYDEIVFMKVTPELKSILSKRKGIPEEIEQENDDQVFDAKFAAKNQSVVQYSKYWQKYEPDQHKVKLETAVRFVKGELALLNERIKDLDNEVIQLEQELNK